MKKHNIDEGGAKVIATSHPQNVALPSLARDYRYNITKHNKSTLLHIANQPAKPIRQQQNCN